MRSGEELDRRKNPGNGPPMLLLSLQRPSNVSQRVKKMHKGRLIGWLECRESLLNLRRQQMTRLSG